LLIANEETDLFAHLDERVVSRLQPCTRISFDTYGDDKLVSILADRVRWGLRPDVVTDAQLRRIADAAAGDARIAIGVLRVTARTASRNDVNEIHDKHIDAAVAEAKAEIKRKAEEKLTHH
jgi:Cdc6-like AAA superfamily ATPase